jgi:surface polysaccharide O-acyltransferase-like enzyme
VKESMAVGAVIHPLDADWSILTIVQSVAVFVLIKLLFMERTERKVEQKICSHLAGDVLGIYLVHIAVLGGLNRIGISNVMFGNDSGKIEALGTIFGVLITMLLTTGISVLVIEIMRKLPVLRRTV